MNTVYFRTPAKNVFSLGEDGTLIHLTSSAEKFIGVVFHKKHTMLEVISWFGTVEIIDKEEVILNV